MDYPTTLIALLPHDRPDLGEAAYKAGADGSLLGAPGFQAHLSRVIALATPQAQLRTENERLKRALRDAEREVARSRQASRWRDLREALIPLAAHQLKNPLTVILGYSALLLKAPEVGAERRLRGAAATLHRECRRLRQVVEELLEYLRLESDGATPGRQPFDLAELVRSVGAGRGAADQPRMRVSASAVPFTGDYGKLSSALDALLALRAATGACGLTLGCHDVAQLAAAGVRDAPPKGERFATIAIGTGQMCEGSAPLEGAWQPCLVDGVAEPDQALRVLIAAAIVGKHGGMLYTRATADGDDYLLVLPLAEREAARPAEAHESAGREFPDRRTDGDDATGHDASAQAAAFD
jgi:hypothetical protein